MDSLTTTLSITLSGKATGITGNSSLSSPVRASISNTFSSTGTGAAQANQCIGPQDRTLAASTSETLDLATGLASILGETITTSTDIVEGRIFLIYHKSTSTASSITVGNAASNQFTGLVDTAAFTATLKPGCGILMWAPTTTGMTLDATHKDFKVTNNSGSVSAVYTIALIGSTS